jgi:ABC-type glycerol-3-phosphate transport system permease component
MAVVLSILTVAPVVVMAVTALKPTAQLHDRIPTAFTLDHVRSVLNAIPLGTRLANTVFKALLQATLIWIHQSLKPFPGDLIGMARIDGLGPWNILWRLVVPNL